ncbi:MAG TPA: hypothetical protein VF607_06715, partial [Verrucomicrobiae bacterium]
MAILSASWGSVTARAQLIYSQTFDTDPSANWVVLQGSTAGQKSLANFQFNYSTVGIPEAPHSGNLSSGKATTGLKLMANVDPTTQLGSSVIGCGLSASPTDFSISDNFDMHVDMWANYNGVNTANIVGPTAYNSNTSMVTGGGGSGSTILYGCGYGTAGTAAQIAGSADSVYVGVTSDNGSS